MLNVIADTAAGIDPQAVGIIIASVVSSMITYGVTTRKRQGQASPDDEAKRVYLEDKFATREEVKAIKEDLDGMRSLIRKTEIRAHERMDNLANTMGELVGIVSVIRDHVCKPKTRI